MRFCHAITIATLLAALSCKKSEGRTRRANSNGLVGTWRALETGHVFFQAVSGLAASREARGQWFGADSSALRALLASAAAYFGTYVASPQNGTVIHRIEGEIPPNSGTTEIATPYELRGDTLILGHDSTAHWKFLRVRP